VLWSRIDLNSEINARLDMAISEGIVYIRVPLETSFVVRTTELLELLLIISVTTLV